MKWLPMKVAIPLWNGRVSPVFDVATKVLIVEIEGGVERSREDVVFHVEQPRARAIHLANTGANVLICGAISWPLEMAIAASGIEVIAQTCGDVEQVLAAFTDGRLHHDAFLMPGCCGRRRQFRERRRQGHR